MNETLVAFFYLLARGTPDCRGLGWGEINSVIDACNSSGLTIRLTSEAGEALAREQVARLQATAAPCDGVAPAKPASPEDLKRWGEYWSFEGTRARITSHVVLSAEVEEPDCWHDLDPDDTRWGGPCDPGEIGGPL